MAIICWGNLAKSADSTERIEQSISAYVQDHDSNPNAHMGVDYSMGAHRLQTVLDHPYGSIKYFHIYDIHADKITAGAMVIKGNGPYIVVQDDGGTERVKIYPEGVIIKNGLFSVQNENNQVIIDKRGLWGSNIVYINEAQMAEDIQVGGDVKFYPLGNLKHGFYLARQSPVMMWSNIIARLSGDAPSATIRVMKTGGYWPTEQWLINDRMGAGDVHQPIQFTTVIMCQAGDNEIVLQGARNTPDGDVIYEGVNYRSAFGYMVLGN